MTAPFACHDGFSTQLNIWCFVTSYETIGLSNSTIPIFKKIHDGDVWQKIEINKKTILNIVMALSTLPELHL